MAEPLTDKELHRIQREDHRSPITLRLLATIARLQERVEEAEGGAKMLRQELDAAVKREKTAWCERDDYRARDKLRGEALPDPGKLRHLADWFDEDDEEKGRASTVFGDEYPDEVQRELRRWASEIEAAIAISPEQAGQ